MQLTKEEIFLSNLPSPRRNDPYARRDAQPATISEMTIEQRRAYDRTKRAESRAAQTQATLDGAIKPTVANIRDALADAAIMLLAVDGPGAAEIQNVLGKVFAARIGVVLAVARDAKRGKLRTKLLQQPLSLASPFCNLS
ncbi:hypothetical protein FKO01_04050 [Mesorhizobium sp. B2-3-3]|nr:hypothetical protein FKO01_04050 [Mesorhizobium sp. B2-3-3]